MILPERVFGRPGAHCSQSGLAMGPISLRTHWTSSFFSASEGSLAQVQRDIGVNALALDIMRGTHDSTLSDFGWATRALSTSAVPIRWPDTLMTSSTRPVIQ